MKLIDLTGLSFGTWTVQRRAANGGGRKARWICRCACGFATDVDGRHLKTGKSSCPRCSDRPLGHFKTEHGLRFTPEWKAWSSMRERCLNPKNRSFARYGARGIKICERWLAGFPAFYQDMGPRPSSKHSIDRIDNDGDYELGNCRWATRKRQTRNRRNTVYIEAHGRRQSLSDWADEIGVREVTLHKRLQAGWSDADVIGRPVRAHTRRV